MHNISIALPENAEALEKLINTAYRGETSKQGWTTEADLLDGTRTDVATLTKSINSPGTCMLKYTDGNAIIGCVELINMKDVLYLGLLTVRPERQGKGVGKALLQAAEIFAKAQSCKSIIMTVISIRTELISWYDRNGYKDTGKRKPFAFNDPRFGIPKQKLEFVVLEKRFLF